MQAEFREHLRLDFGRQFFGVVDEIARGFFVGAGYAGVEALGELNDLAHASLRYYPAIRNAPQRWVLVDAAPKILPECTLPLTGVACVHTIVTDKRSG